jgi:hypothetical protein
LVFYLKNSFGRKKLIKKVVEMTAVVINSSNSKKIEFLHF